MIGRSAPRGDALDKAAGRSLYIDDICPDGAWHGVTIRSPVPRGRIRRIAIDSDFRPGEAVFVTARGLGARNRIPMVRDDMPFLAEDEVHYLGEPLALIAAPTLQIARDLALEAKADIDPLPAVLDLASAEMEWRRDPAAYPVLAEQSILRGDPDSALRSAALVLDGTYTTPAAEHVYIEPQGVIAWPRGRGVLVEGSLQCPYYVHGALVRLLDCEPQDVIVRQAVTGGAFGGKEEFPSLLAGHATLLAHACGHPVKMIYSRGEDILYTTKRHPAIVRHRTGLTEDGRLLAMMIDVILDGGAYVTMSPVVLARAILTAAGPYECPNISVHGICLATATPPNGAFRGFGAPQVSFACEVHMDRLAERANLAPHEFRLRNLVRVGSVTASGQVLRESVGAEKVLAEAVTASDFAAKWEREHASGQQRRYAGSRQRASAGSPQRRRPGIGIALTWHGSGFTGGGEARLASRAALTLERDGRLLIRVASTEIGQGTATVLPQIAAARLGIAAERISFAQPDTAEVPNSGPTVASRTVMIVGSLIDDCAGQVADALRSAVALRNKASADELVWRAGELWPVRGAAAIASFENAIEILLAEKGPQRFESVYNIPSWIHWDEESFRGDAYAAFGYACTIAEVEVDSETFEIDVKRVISACDVGRAVNPAAVEGQIEGGVVQGTGFATLERLTLHEGRYAQERLQTYLIPTSLDAPAIESLIVEEPYSGGPGGAKGMGELPINGVAPAIANAVARAVGIRVHGVPITPEILFARRGEMS